MNKNKKCHMCQKEPSPETHSVDYNVHPFYNEDNRRKFY